MGFLLWLTYGVVNRDLPLVISNTVAVIVTSTLLATMWIVGRRSGTAPDRVM